MSLSIIRRFLHRNEHKLITAACFRQGAQLGFRAALPVERTLVVRARKGVPKKLTPAFRLGSQENQKRVYLELQLLAILRTFSTLMVCPPPAAELLAVPPALGLVALPLGLLEELVPPEALDDEDAGLPVISTS